MLTSLVRLWGRENQRPLGSDLGEATQEDLTEATSVLDLTEHRLDRLLAQAVARAPAGALEAGRHRGHPRAGPDLSLTTRIGVAVTAAAGHQVAPDAARRQRFEVVLAAEAGIGRDFARGAAERGPGGLDQRDEAGLVAAVGGQALGGDDLVDAVDRDLAVIALDVAIPGLEHPTVGIGEIALRPRRRTAVRSAAPAGRDRPCPRTAAHPRAVGRPWPRPPERLWPPGYARAAPAGRRPSPAARHRAGPGRVRRPQRHPRPRPAPASP